MKYFIKTISSENDDGPSDYPACNFWQRSTILSSLWLQGNRLDRGLKIYATIREVIKNYQDLYYYLTMYLLFIIKYI